MEKITYRLTLDTFKGGVQKVLRGVYTGDVLSRRVAISLSAGSVPCKIFDEESSVSAVMYVTKPSGVTNYGNCEILDNVVYYDIIQYDVDVEGIVEMQLKVMSEDSVLYAPVFALEVQQSKNSDTIAEQSPQFTALEAALAKAEEVYRKRLVSIELTDDLVFIAHYGDNSTYESDAIKNALAFVDDAEKARVIAENERVLAEEQRVLAELERVLAEQRRNSNYDSLWTSLNEVIKDTEELQKYVESLVEEGFITESRVLELIEEHGGGAVPDNVLVASEESAQTEPAPKVNADLFGGHGEDYFASAEDIENITNGTTQVGNAKTLDGHGAEYFLPRSGGTVNGNIEAVGNSGEQRAFIIDNDTRRAALVVRANGDISLMDTTNGKDILYSLVDGKTVFNGTASGNLPLDGGTLRRTARRILTLDNIHESASGSSIGFSTNGTFWGEIGVLKNGTLVFNNTAVEYALLHTGNKPTGTYTGNGDATIRKIAIGGIGNMVLLRNNANYDFVLVTGAGYIGKQGTSFVCGTDASWSSSDGNLSMSSTSALLNANGVGYLYYLL